jgi:tetratricopeptide (TPR) repeat protein
VNYELKITNYELRITNLRIKSIVNVFLFLALVSCGTVGGMRSPEGQPPLREDGDAAYYYHAEGIKAYAIHNDSAGAANYFRKAIEADSMYAPAYYELAGLGIEGGDAQSVLKYSEAANRMDSTNLTYKNQLARALVVNGKYDQATDMYTALMREDSHNPLNYTMLAALYDYAGQPFTAISILDSAEYKLGRMDALSNYKRQLLINVHLYDKAIEESESLIKDYPYDDENYVVLAELYSMMGKDSLALENYKEALRIDSTNIATLKSVGEYYRMRDNTGSYLAMVKRMFESDAMPLEEKVSMFGSLTANIDFYRDNFFSLNAIASRLWVKYPDNYSVLDLYATHLISSGELLAALVLYKNYIEANPAKLEPYMIVMDIESYMQRPDSVARYSNLALSHFPDNTDLYIRRGFALDNIKDTKGALKAYRQAYRHAGSDSLRSAVTGIIGDMYYEHGRHTKSYRLYDKALKMYPDNAAVLNNYAYFVSEDGREYEKALAMSARANEIEQGNATYLDTQAWILYRLGRYEEAKTIMLKAISLDVTDSAVLLLHYGDILYELKEYFMAKRYWRRAFEKGYDAAAIEERLKRPEQ